MQQGSSIAVLDLLVQPWQKWLNHLSWRIFIKLFYFGFVCSIFYFKEKKKRGKKRKLLLSVIIILTANHLPPSDPILCILFSHTKSPLVFHQTSCLAVPTSSSFYHLSLASNMHCPSDVVIPDPIHRCHSKDEPDT